MKRRLAEAAFEFKQSVDRHAPSRSAAAAELAGLLSGPHWSRVIPAKLWLSELAPWEGSAAPIAFDPSQWPEVYGSFIYHALDDCHGAFVEHDRAYRAAVRILSQEELDKLFPDGPARP
jgi:hypothetical protein